MREMPLLARSYILGVAVVAAVLIAVMAPTAGVPNDIAILAAFTVLTVLGELRSIQAPVGKDGVDLTFSTAFAFAILIGFGAVWAAAASVVASLVCDVLARKQWWKAAFNASQFVVVSVVTGAVFELCTGHAHLDLGTAFSRPSEIVGAICAATTYFVLNLLMLSTAMGLAQGTSVFGMLLEESKYQVLGSLGMFGLAPVAVVIAGRSVWLLPVLLIPLAIAYQSTIISIEKEHQALHDSLTGLPNRELFRLRAIEAVDDAARERNPWTAIMLIDLDRFKEINDTLGHSTGDLVLTELGPRLLGAVGEGRTVARLGGDEFGVVLPDLRDIDEAEEIAMGVLQAIRAPILLHDLDLELDASIGIALYREHGLDADSLIQRADIAMYAAKETGAGHKLYTPMLDHTSPMQLNFVGELRQAVETSGLCVWYQPQVLTDSCVVIGAEALLRWNHPVRGIVVPDDFIPVAEQSGLIRDLTRFVLREAIAANARWQRQGLDLSVSVNLSARTLHDLDLPDLVRVTIEREQVDPARVILEITETSIMEDPATAISALSELRSVGVQVAIDDYGTGHSNLAQVMALPLDLLKIDKSLVTGMSARSQSSVIVSSTVELGHNLGLKVVAEGVETTECWQLLCGMGCDEAQGFFFGRPVPEADLLRNPNLARRRTGTLVHARQHL
ncbi:MAG: EAL domain-containing protein [Acidimicrobiia bacterium]|nr:EAL domain-containing protein [Acidimicrobiia bacterium]